MKDMEMTLHCPRGPRQITRVLKSGEAFPALIETREHETRISRAVLLAVKMEEEGMRPGCGVLQKPETARECVLPQVLQAGTWPCFFISA